jgi:uncharacterized membrane protein
MGQKRNLRFQGGGCRDGLSGTRYSGGESVVLKSSLKLARHGSCAALIDIAYLSSVFVPLCRYFGVAVG